MIRIAIVDDADDVCEYIESFLEDFSKTENISIQYDSYHRGKEFLSVIEQQYFDCIFLDIEVDEITGIDISKTLRGAIGNTTTEIIYISGHRQYAIDLFDYDPITFLLKPIEDEKLYKAFVKLLKRLKINDNLFSFAYKRDIIRIPVKEILYFTSNDHKVVLQTADRTYEFYDTLDRIAVLLERQNFLHIHKSFLVNSLHIQKYSYDSVIMDNGDQLTIAQSKRKEIRAWQLKNDQEEMRWFS